ncbi:MAG: hypothetical protein JO101_07700, partial [Candidatus Eremiobacteraeota bacterium]|nr:hypothetical protein [Candidatus Eremiobacteraeota bacterium]
MTETFPRRRVTSAFRSVSDARVLPVIAPSGYGKTTAVAHALAGAAMPTVHLRTPRRVRSLLAFLRAFTDALSPLVPGARLSLGNAYDAARASRTPASELGLWLCEHLESLRATIVIDDLDQAAACRAVPELLARLIDERPGDLRWIVAAQQLDDLPFARWLAGGDAVVPITEQVLALTPEEAATIATASGSSLNDAQIEALVGVMNGWTAGVALGIRLADGPRSLETILREGDRTTAFARLLESALQPLDTGSRDLLGRLAALPDLRPPLVSAFVGSDGLGRLETIRRRLPGLFIGEGDAEAGEAAFDPSV